MAEYQVIPRRYRPQKFKDVVAQESIVTTLKNAIRYNRLAHAYLFCGSRGTGKTTLARIFAKALNCKNLSEDFEPCNTCSSCKEIANGSSLDVLEIDGASHRGIDDIRQINETVGYSTSCGGYKIYIIDEVHMLTKEAFNALLKTLEEPPAKVKFFFATTEPHKVLPTILSRCQRFNLNRIPIEKITCKLKAICEDLNISVDEQALLMIANRAEGGLRDAESLLDQIFSFHGSNVSAEIVSSVLGIMTRDCLFELDEAGKEGRLTIAFDIADKIFSEGKDLTHFVEMLTEHFRNILLTKISGNTLLTSSLSESEYKRYVISASYYSQELCLNLLEYLVEAQNQIRFAPSGRVALETILLHIIRSHRKVPIEVLVRRLVELEHAIANTQQRTPLSQPTVLNQNNNISSQHSSQPPLTDTRPIQTPPQPKAPSPQPIPPPPPSTSEIPKNKEPEQKIPLSMTVDPNPSPQDLPRSYKAKPTPPKQEIPKEPLKTNNFVEIDAKKLKSQSHYDTLLQFASVELEGKLEKIQIKKF